MVIDFVPIKSFFAVYWVYFLFLAIVISGVWWIRNKKKRMMLNKKEVDLSEIYRPRRRKKTQVTEGITDLKGIDGFLGKVYDNVPGMIQALEDEKQEIIRQAEEMKDRVGTINLRLKALKDLYSKIQFGGSSETTGK